MMIIQTCVIWIRHHTDEDSLYLKVSSTYALLKGENLPDTIPFPENVLIPESVRFQRNTSRIDKSENREAPLGVLLKGN